MYLHLYIHEYIFMQHTYLDLKHHPSYWLSRNRAVVILERERERETIMFVHAFVCVGVRVCAWVCVCEKMLIMFALLYPNSTWKKTRPRS